MAVAVPRPLYPAYPLEATRIVAEDRAGLERLCRYVMRPPLAAGRLQQVDAEHLTFRLKTPWSDGTTHLLLSPLELIEKLAALVPPRRLNLVRYHGNLAPNARHRRWPCRMHPLPLPTPHRYSWAALLARVFALDVTVLSRLWRPAAAYRGVDRPGFGPALPFRRRAAQPAAPADPAAAAPQTEWDFAA